MAFREVTTIEVKKALRQRLAGAGDDAPGALIYPRGSPATRPKDARGRAPGSRAAPRACPRPRRTALLDGDLAGDGLEIDVHALPHAPRVAPIWFEPRWYLRAVQLARTGPALDVARATDWAARVRAARADWTSAFGGEQFSLGRAFYTDFEEGAAARYFAGAARSDATVERHLPGMQAEMRALLAKLLEADVRPRRGWCGAGVHVFPAGGKVARRGGVVHADTEGLAAAHAARRLPAVSLVVMLQPALRGGGLRLWDHLYSGADHLPEDAPALPAQTVRSIAGGVALVDSYRFHQIAPFGGGQRRVSITLHAARTSGGYWESWF